MPKTANELRQDKAALVASADNLNQRAETENRDLTEAEQAEFSEFITRASGLDVEISRATRRESLESARQELNRSAGRRIQPFDPDNRFTQNQEYNAVLRNWFLGGTQKCDWSTDALHRMNQHGMNPNCKEIVFRALQSDTGTGTNIVNKTIAPNLIETLRQLSPFLNLVTIDPTDDGNPRLYPIEDDTANEAVIVAQAAAITDQDPTLGNREIPTHMYSSRFIKVTLQMLQDTNTDLPAYINRCIVGRNRQAWERHATVGTGTGQPWGLVTRATAGVTGAAGTGPTYNHFIDLEASVGVPYRPGSVYVVSDDTLVKAKKLVDSQGRPLWVESVQKGAPPTINGYPYIVSPFLDPWGTGTKTPMAFGRLDSLTLRVVRDISITRLDELFAANGMVGWVGMARAGADMTGPAASFKKLTTVA